MDLHVTFDGRRDRAGQMYRQIRAAILDGRLRPGAPLPPTRELAARLAVSRTTVVVAYDRLAGEGFVTGRVGAGTFVSYDVAVAPPFVAAPEPARLRTAAVWDDMPDPSDTKTRWAYDFRSGGPDATLFPYESWRRLLVREHRAPTVGDSTYGDPSGEPGLREAIARHAGLSRSSRITAASVLVTNGTQQALDLLARVLLEPGDTVAVEHPGYPPPVRLFASLGARVAHVPVDPDGLVVDALPERARLVYVTPSHQFPLGVPMSLARRMALLDWADRHDAAIVEDDYDSEFRYSGRPVEPLHSLDRSGRVIYVGSFSKVMLPTLRLGFVAAPPALHRTLRKARLVSDWHSPVATQRALASFIDDGLLARHIRKMRRTYAARHERIQALLTRDFAAWLDVVPSAAGLHLAALARDPATPIDDIVAAVARRGVAVQSLAVFALDRPTRPGVVLGYGGVPLSRIPEGLRRLRRCFEQVA